MFIYHQHHHVIENEYIFVLLNCIELRNYNNNLRLLIEYKIITKKMSF
jgi:hypothetical protein